MECALPSVPVSPPHREWWEDTMTVFWTSPGIGRFDSVGRKSLFLKLCSLTGEQILSWTEIFGMDFWSEGMLRVCTKLRLWHRSGTSREDWECYQSYQQIPGAPPSWCEGRLSLCLLNISVLSVPMSDWRFLFFVYWLKDWENRF